MPALTPAALQLIVAGIEFAQQYGPGIISAGEKLVETIRNHGELTDAQKADLIARVNAAGNYTPREGV